MPDVDEGIDRLYQLPLDQFTPARNALAKELKRPTIKDLEKPNVAAWAVNQLYWHERETWDRLIKAADRLRAAHRQLLGGKSADIRETEKAHRHAIRNAIDTVKALLTRGGQAVTQATLTAVQETLESLPAEGAPGRLTRPLKPMGFEALSGVTVRPGLRIVARTDTAASPRSDAHTNHPSAPASTAKQAQRERAVAKAREREERERRERQREAEKALKAAEAAMLRAEDAVKKAEKTLGELRAARDLAVTEYQRARLRAHE